MGTLGGPNVWRVSGEERVKHDEQFFTLKPVNGFITGDQARGFFLQSGLPSAVLAQIWNLADLNKDGKMDRREFSIAMHLIQKKLQGFSIPPTLPETLKSDPDPTMGVFGQVGFVSNPPPPVSASGGWGQQQMMGGGGMMPGAAPPVGVGLPPQAIPAGVASPLTLPRTNAGKIDWTINQANKLRYSQQFNAIDKSKTGFLAGAHARNIFTQAGLPNPVLAQIWNFADLDKDGRLTVEEFSIAMHLIDMVKLGVTLPVALPLELVPPHLQHLHRQRTLSFGSDDAAPANDDGDILKGAKSAASFEDKRRQNFEKGQAELDRRRQLLQEQERREREERDRKEREEAERRERERLEIERRRQLEMEKLQAKQREEQQKQEEEYRKMMEQREAARRELERQRQLEFERQRLIELTQQRQRDQEQLCHSKQKQKNLSFQLQALNEKSQDLNNQITEMRDKIVTLTSSIESMKRDRDTKLVAIENGKRTAQDLKTKSMQFGNEKLKLMGQKQHVVGAGGDVGENPVSESYRQVMHTYRNREINLETLRQSLIDIEIELHQKQPTVDEIEKNFNDVDQTAKRDAGEYRELVNRLNNVLVKVRQSRGIADNNFASQNSNGVAAAAAAVEPGGGAFFDDSAWGEAISQVTDAGGAAWASDEAWKTANGHAASTEAAAAANTSKYRAIYEFSGTNADELSFQPGDIIIVFNDHHGDEGWLAGQIGDKVGWFPQAFADLIDSAQGNDSTDNEWRNDQQQALPQKLERIQEVPFEREDDTRSSTRSSNVGQAFEHKTQIPTEIVAEAGEIVQAQFAWKAKTENHLSFNKGDQIRILEKQEMWWRGDLNGVNGWFPKSYVKTVDASRRKSETPEPLTLRKGVEIPTAPAFKRKSESQEFPSQASKDQRATSALENGEWYVAVYGFAAAEQGDLGFEAGDKILVVQKTEDWWTGRLGDREGVFPANYVQKAEAGHQQQSNNVIITNPVVLEPVVEQEIVEHQNRDVPVVEVEPSSEVGEVIAQYQATDTNQLSLSVGDFVKIRAKSPTGWWEGELQKKGEGKRIGWFPGNYVQLLADDKSIDQNKNEIVEAIFDYVKQQEDELAFSRGDKIVVVQKVDENWWKGELNDGRVGLFPANYVKPCGT